MEFNLSKLEKRMLKERFIDDLEKYRMHVLLGCRKNSEEENQAFRTAFKKFKMFLQESS